MESPRAPGQGRNGGEGRAACGFPSISTLYARPDIETVAAAALPRLLELCRQWLPGGRLIGREWTCGSLQGEPGRSCKVNVETGRWADFATEAKGGDAVSLYAAIRRLSQRDAADALADLLGLADACATPAAPRLAARDNGANPPPAPLPETIRHPHHGTPSRVWRYCDAAGRLLFALARFDPPGRRKEVLPLTWDGAAWVWKGPPDPRPLYGLPDLAARPDAPVLVVEGEKAADAARDLFPSHVSITWPGGSGAVGKADWRPLRGRSVTVWPDNDATGVKAAAELRKALASAGAASVAVVEIPADWPEGWDVADAPPPGVTRDTLADMLAGANAEASRPRLRTITAAEPAAWPEPDLSLARAEAMPPPDWPADLFPGWWRGFFADAAEARGCPPDYVGLAVLAAVASRLGNARWGSPWEGWAEPPVLWCAAVGLPSSGKSSGMDEAVAALSTLEAEANEDWEERKRAYLTRKQEADEVREKWKAEVKAAVKNGAAPPLQPQAAREPDTPAKRRAVTSDPTIEKAGQMAAQNPRGLLLLRDEVSGWLAGMGRYSGSADSDRAFWLTAYGGRRWMPDRVKDGDAGVVVPHLTFGIVGTIQPDRVASLLLASDDDGLAARFLYAWPAPRKPTRPTRPPPTGRLAAALRRLEALPWHPPERGVLPFTEEAADVLQQWREETAAMAAESSGLFLSWVGKLPGFALRLAVVFQHLDWLAQPEGTPPPAAVDADAVVRAVGFLADYAAPMARRVFGEAALPEAERDARRLARWWLRQNPRPEVLNAKALRRMQNGPGIATAERMDAALADLAAAGWCRPAPARAGDMPGRSRKDWAMNPALRGVRP